MTVARRVARNAVYKVSSTVVSNISGLFLVIILARVLKPNQFGIYSLTLSITMLALVFSNLGISSAITRYISYYHGKQNLKKIRGHFKYFLKLELCLALIISISLVIYSKRIALIFSNQNLEMPLKFAGVIVFFASLVDVINAFFSGLQEFRYIFIKQIVYEVFRWSFVVPLSYLFLAAGAVEGIALAYLATFVILIIIMIRKFKNYIFGDADAADNKVLSFVGYTTFANITGIIYAYIDSLMIGYLLNTTDVGYYRAAYTVILAVISLISMSDVLFPVFTQLEGISINNAIHKLMKYTSLISFPISIVILFLSNKIILIIYGQKYLVAAQVMKILSLMIIPSSYNYLGTIFSAKEVPKYSAYVTVTSMILNVFLNYLLIKTIGIKGAALATLISKVFNIVLILYLLYHIFNLDIPITILLKSVFCLLITVAILEILPYTSSLILVLIKITFSISMYYLTLIATKVLTYEDIIYIFKLVKYLKI